MVCPQASPSVMRAYFRVCHRRESWCPSQTTRALAVVHVVLVLPALHTSLVPARPAGLAAAFHAGGEVGVRTDVAASTRAGFVPLRGAASGAAAAAHGDRDQVPSPWGTS